MVKAKTRRTILRVAHMLGAALIGTFVYSPWTDHAGFRLLMQVLVIPGLSLTGLLMWKPRLLRRTKVEAGGPK